MILYKKGRKYKYNLHSDFEYSADIQVEDPSELGFVKIDAEGHLVIKKGYSWDGPSGPSIDTKNFMQGSLVHDALYQLMRAGVIAQHQRKRADEILREICIADGMSRIRAWSVYNAVRTGGASSARRIFDATSFKKVLIKELYEIFQSRTARGISDPTAQPEPSAPAEAVFSKAHESQLTGLAFSGGGIRSATFNLGVLQGLAKLGLLNRFDYLSTVSGGGYIGSWLSAWIRNRDIESNSSEPGIATVANALKRGPNDAKRGEEPHEIRFLRDYSNYLTPRLGLFSSDAWTLGTTYLRNLILNLLVLILMSFAVLILPHIFVYLYAEVTDGLDEFGYPASLAIFASVVAFIVVLMNLLGVHRSKRLSFFAKPFVIVCFVIFPMLIAAWLVSARLSTTSESGTWWKWGFSTGIFYFALWFIAWLVALPFRWRERRAQSAHDKRQQESVRSQWKEFLPSRAKLSEAAGKTFAFGRLMGFAFVAGFLAGPLYLIIAAFMDLWSSMGGAKWHAAIWGMPLVAFVFMLVGVVHIGLAGRLFDDEDREWWSRLGASLFIGIFVWSAISSVAVYGPLLVKMTGIYVDWGLLVGWVFTSLGGLAFGQKVGRVGEEKNLFRKLVLLVAPYVFVVGLLVLLSTLLLLVLPELIERTPQWIASFAPRLVPNIDTVATAADTETWALSYWHRMDLTLGPGLVLWFAVFTVLAALLSTRVGINDFSMHGMYRDRLVRCYFGASNPRRKPQPFTGLDPADNKFKINDFRPKEKRYTGPYLIVNAALNLVGGGKLAWQERKATSFVFTPRYCGFEHISDENSRERSNLSNYGYRPSKRYGEKIPLGTAMAISGAAASPNMGYSSSPALTFLMTVFNVRLGWWLGNPRHKSTAKMNGPRVGLIYLISELFGLTNDNSRFVYLSDGGHFENLGLYELVRRRCQFVVASDASADPKLTFADLGNAIQKCRTDFGIDIDIDVDQIRRRDKEGHSAWHCSVGRIRYSHVDANAPDGTLLYIKASLTGDEPEDITRYAAQHPDFPHQPTADQWFGESQFESYRALGENIVESVFSVADRNVSGLQTEALFRELRKHWFPPSDAAPLGLGTHESAVEHILEALRTRPELKFLDVEMYPGLRASVPTQQLSSVRNYDDMRAGFYLCQRMTQLMESVYHDRQLDAEFEHPDNRGWINLFRRWTLSRTFRFTWSVTASTHGARFQTFCEQKLNLTAGSVAVWEDDTGLKARAGETDKFWKEARNKYGLDSVETRHLRNVLKEHAGKKNMKQYQIFPLQLEVEDPFKDGTSLRFNIGFVILESINKPKARRLVFFRIRPHLRNTGLARRALMKLLEDSRFAHGGRVLEPVRPFTSKMITEEDMARLAGMLRSVARELESRTTT